MSANQTQEKTSEPKPIRSPSYPNTSLREAVEMVGMIESKYRSTPVDRMNAAKLIGYTTLSGPANKTLAALADYGLLARAGKGETRVTERARDILHAGTPEQRHERLLEAALEPVLFRELKERFTGIPVPPEDGVVTYLNRQGFNPNAVRPATRAFLDTMSYLEEIGANESHGNSDNANAHSQDNSERDSAMHETTTQSFVSNDRPAPKGSRKEVFTLDEGDVVLTFPENLSPTSYEDLSAHLELFLRKAKRRTETN